jgi:glycosyltransferase involved in cell wall biosynthesis
MIIVKDFLNDQTIISDSSYNLQPLVSVILPTYQRCNSGLLERSITSVLAQKFQDYEFIVVDDGSKDGSSDLIEKYRLADPRIIHIRHEQNSGLPALRVNEGIELARGKYLAFQFDDDLWRTNTLEDLVNEIERHSEPVVVVGKSQFMTRLGIHLSPGSKVDIVALYEQNRFANNSVLFPRELVFKYGMYDPHIGLRRLTDWDLWLRLSKKVPFVIIDKVVSEVFESNPGAIGVTVPWDMALFRFLNSIDRNQLLVPSKWRDYQVDSLSIDGVEVENRFKKRLYEEQIVPYYNKYRHQFPQLSSYTATLPQSRCQYVLYTKQTYDVSNEVTIGHYDKLTSQRRSFKIYYQNLGEMKKEWVKDADILLLMRTVEEHALKHLDLALHHNKPVGLYLDDDLLTFHEYGRKFDYLAPGTPYYQNLIDIIRQVDAVLVTNEYIAASVKEYNPRVVIHNNTIPGDRLPTNIRVRNSAQIKIGYVGSGYRLEEFKLIWDSLVRVSKKYGDRLKFEFWGLDISSLPSLYSPSVQKPFTFSYSHYLDCLQAAQFDILLTPLLEVPRPRLGKSLIKYYETAVAGALGIFSDVRQYKKLEDGWVCLKAGNDEDSWYEVLSNAIEMDSNKFDTIRKRCIEHVREEYSAEAQIDNHEAALRAIVFHAKTRSLRYQDGRPRLVYVLHSAHYGGAEIQLWRRLRLIRRYGIEPIVVIPNVFKETDHGIQLKQRLDQEEIVVEFVEYTCFTEPRSPNEFFSDLERNQIRALLERYSPALVHSVTFIPSFGQICQEMGIPHVSTLYAVDDHFSWASGKPGFTHCSLVQSDCLRYSRRWGELLGDISYLCARDMAPLTVFELGQRKFLDKIGRNIEEKEQKLPLLVLTGTFQERKQQLETIEAIGQLKKAGFACRLIFYGYTHFFPAYVEKCKVAIQDWGLEGSVDIRDFTEDIQTVLCDADMLLSLSTYESFPGSIKDALAAGILVVATPVGGVEEIIKDGITGILCNGTSIEDLVEGIQRALLLSFSERQKIVEQARRIARLELHPYRAANDLFRMYNTAIDVESSKLLPPNLQLSHRSIVETPHEQSLSKTYSPSQTPTSTMQIGAGLRYVFRPRHCSWEGLDVLIGTHMRQVSGQLVLTLRSEKGNILRTVTKDLRYAQDNDWLEFRFEPITHSANHSFIMDFNIVDPGTTTIVSLYQSSPNYKRYIHLLRRLLQKSGFLVAGGQLYCREYYR